MLEATSEDLSVLESVQLPSDQRSAQSLLPAIKMLLQRGECSPQQLDLICVTTGPGSFTGLRIGVTTAKTLAYATGAKLAEVHTLAAIAAGVAMRGERLWTILDAQRKELFVARFDADWQTRYGKLPETQIVSIEAWLDALRPGDMVSGPPLKKLRDQLPAEIHVADASQWAPLAENVGQLGVAALRHEQVVDAMQLVPSYFRKSAAEEKKDAQPSAPPE